MSSRRPHGIVYGFDPADVDWIDDDDDRLDREWREAVERDDVRDDGAGK